MRTSPAERSSRPTPGPQSRRACCPAEEYETRRQPNASFQRRSFAQPRIAHAWYCSRRAPRSVLNRQMQVGVATQPRRTPCLHHKVVPEHERRPDKVDRPLRTRKTTTWATPRPLCPQCVASVGSADIVAPHIFPLASVFQHKLKNMSGNDCVRATTR